MNKTTLVREIWWDAGQPGGKGVNPSWPCGWCYGTKSIDEEGNVTDQDSGPLPGENSGDPKRVKLSDRYLRSVAVRAYGKEWRNAQVKRP